MGDVALIWRLHRHHEGAVIQSFSAIPFSSCPLLPHRSVTMQLSFSLKAALAELMATCLFVCECGVRVVGFVHGPECVPCVGRGLACNAGPRGLTVAPAAAARGLMVSADDSGTSFLLP